MSEPPPDRAVYKICSRAAWSLAKASGALELSADDARDGFVHLSTRAQLEGTLAKHFARASELVLLEVLLEHLNEATLRWEISRDGALFPHYYAALPVSAIARVIELADPGSGERLPPGF